MTISASGQRPRLSLTSRAHRDHREPAMDTYVAKPYVAGINPAPEWRHKLDLLCLQIRVRPVDIVDAEDDAADADVLGVR